jgi:hypothetical protein
MIPHRYRTRLRKTNRYYERLSLELQQNQDIPPYTRPTTELLGTPTTTLQTHYNNNSENRVQSPTELSTDNNSNTSDSGSVYTIRVYNRLEGRWEEPRPLPLRPTFPYQPEYLQWKQREEERLSTEPHPTHPDRLRPFYCEHHRLRVYDNDTDSSFSNTSTYNKNKSDTTDSNESDYTSEPDSDSNFSDSSSITIGERVYQYWQDHDFNSGRIIDFEYDSTGDFPLANSSKSDSQSSHHQSTQSAGYATQEPDYPYRTDDYAYFDDGIDPVTGRYNPTYWRHIDEIQGNLPVSTGTRNTTTTQHVSLPSSTIHSTVVPPTRVPSTEQPTRITTGHSSTHRINPLPTIGNRYHLPILAARKSVPVLRTGSGRKIVARKSVTRHETTITRSVVQPDTTNSNPYVHTRKTKTTKNKRVYETSSSSSVDTPPLPPFRRYKKDPNA